jgi:hypothetical protein
MGAAVVDLARFAKIAYHDDEEKQWLEHAQRDGWRRMPALCSDDLHIDTFLNGHTAKGVIAFRGTACAADALQDALLAALQEDTSPRFLNTLEYVKSWILPNLRRFGGTSMDIQLTGHSLGGALALYVSYHTGLPGEVFNAYCSPLMQQRSLVPGADSHGYSNITLHIVQEDHPVGSSGLAMAGMHTIVYSQPAGSLLSMDSHALRNFLGVCQPLEPRASGSVHAVGAAAWAVVHRGGIEAAGAAIRHNPQAAAVRQGVEAGIRRAPGAGRRMLDAVALFVGSTLKVVGG